MHVLDVCKKEYFKINNFIKIFKKNIEMKQKVSTKILVIILVILVGIVVVNKMFLSKKSERNFKEILVTIDTTNISEISFIPKQSTDEITFVKKSNNWFVKSGDNEYNASSRNIKGLLSELAKLKPKSVVGRKKETWAKFEVNDSLGTKLKVKEGSKLVADLVVGKFSYKQTNGPQGGQNYIITSYVRLTNDKDIYAIDGQLSLMFNKDVNSYRNTEVAHFVKENVTEIIINTPNGNTTTAKQNNTWLTNGEQADSLAIDKYLSSITNLTNRNFINDSGDLSNPMYSFKIKGNNFNEIEINAYPKDSVSSYLVSNQNLGTVFEDKNNEIINKLLDVLKKQE